MQGSKLSACSREADGSRGIFLKPLCCFLVVFMKHRLLGRLTVAVVMSAFGVSFAADAQGADLEQRFRGTNSETFDSDLSQAPSADFPEILDSEPSQISNAGLASGSTATPSEQPEPGESAYTPALQEVSTLTNVYAHTLDDKQAATLFVNSIPVLTFLGGELPTHGDSKAIEAEENLADIQDPVVQANAVANQLATLASEADASELRVRWDDDQELFVIAWGEQDLIAFNQQTMLAGSTEDPAEDALQAANRLRRLLGNASPLTEIEGRPEPVVAANTVASSYTGIASWYGPGFHGRRSASGEVFNQHAFTAAHRTLPFGTRVRVTNVSTGQQVVVRINDRGPFGHGRIIDLSAGAAAEIGLRRMGVGQVQVEVLSGQ